MNTADAEMTTTVATSWFGVMANWFRPTKGTLFSPAADILMAGGASIIFFAIVQIFVNRAGSIFLWSWAVYYAAFIVNYPHFAASYLLMYQDARAGFRDFGGNRTFALKLWWAGVLVPLGLLMYFVFALTQSSSLQMGYLANAMFFFVGWHYIKQIFGCVIVLSSAKKVYYTKWERWSLLTALYSLWMISFVGVNLYGGTTSYYGISYTSLTLLGGLMTAFYVLLLVSTATTVILLARKALAGQRPPVSALVAIVAIYVWYLPALAHPFYYYIIPFFHSLQYLLFVLAYKRNSSVVRAFAAEPNVRLTRPAKHSLGIITTLGSLAFIVIPAAIILGAMTAGQSGSLETGIYTWFGVLSQVPTASWVTTLGVLLVAGAGLYVLRSFAKRNAVGAFTHFFVKAVLLGIIMFSVLPTMLDILGKTGALPGPFSYNQVIFGTSLYLFFVTIFINIHHYFIDNVIWKRNNPYIRSMMTTPE